MTALHSPGDYKEAESVETVRKWVTMPHLLPSTFDPASDYSSGMRPPPGLELPKQAVAIPLLLEWLQLPGPGKSPVQRETAADEIEAAAPGAPAAVAAANDVPNGPGVVGRPRAPGAAISRPRAGETCLPQAHLQGLPALAQLPDDTSPTAALQALVANKLSSPMSPSETAPESGHSLLGSAAPARPAPRTSEANGLTWRSVFLDGIPISCTGTQGHSRSSSEDTALGGMGGYAAHVDLVPRRALPPGPISHVSQVQHQDAAEHEQSDEASCLEFAQALVGKGLRAAANARGRRRQPRLCCNYLLSVSLTRLQEFDLVPRLIGRGGSNMKSIAHACNAKVRIRGRGSGYFEGPEKKEADLPLQVALSCETDKDYKQGRKMLSELLDNMAAQFALFCRDHNIEPPSRFYVIVEQHSAASQV